MAVSNKKNLKKLVHNMNFVRNVPLPGENVQEEKYLNALLNDAQCEAAIHLKQRKPTYIEDFAKDWGKPYEEAYKMAEELCNVGLCEWTWDDNGKEQINLPLFAPGTMELSLMSKEVSHSKPELGEAFFDLAVAATKSLSQVVPHGHGLVKVVPVEKAIENEPQKVDIEQLSWWINKYSPSLSVAICQCRQASEDINKASEEPVGEWCIQLGKFAESCIKTGRARRITKEEAFAICKKAEELGYVHEVTNVDGAYESMFICNCKWDTCLGLRTAWWCGTPEMVRSNYIAKVDPSKCAACGKCMEVCPQNAAKLGQKICQKNPVTIKDAPVALDHIFLPKQWNGEAFLYNRKNVIPETGTSPCKTACPAHVSVQAYLRLASEGRYAEALELIKKDNPFPAVCGSICNHRCEDECTRGSLDEAVAIDDVKRFIAEKELENGNRSVPEKMYSDPHKIAVIGGGPAGLTCAYFLAVYGHNVTVFEKEEKLGGMMTYGIPAFRLEKNVVDAEIDALRTLGVEFKTGIDVGKDTTIKALRKEGFEGFYLAIGAQGGRKLGVPGEDAEGVISGIDFLKSINTGKGKKLSGKTLVIGGGNVAIDVARSAIRFGANDVALFSLEKREEMPAADDEIKETLEEKIEINNGWGPKEIIVENGKVKAVVFKKCVSVFNAEGRFSPSYDENDTITVPCDYVLTAIGQSIMWGGLLDGLNIKTNKNGTAVADSFTYQTSENDIFVGGDVYTGPRFCIDAIAAGREAAVSLNRAVRPGHTQDIGRDRREFKAIDKENIAIPLGGFDLEKRQIPAYANDKPNFKNSRKCLTEDQIKIESSRCLECGATHIDKNICIGCALCTTRCKFDAITLEKVENTYGVKFESIIPAVVKTLPNRVSRIVKTAVKEKVNG